MEIISESKPRARKNHICDYCGQVIAKGEVYERQLNKMDGDIYTWKNHIQCHEIASKLNMFDGSYDEGLTGEQFREYIDESYHELTSDERKSRDFIIPDFPERLGFVVKHYLTPRKGITK